jgi:hypothetical protein
MTTQEAFNMLQVHWVEWHDVTYQWVGEQYNNMGHNMTDTEVR